MSIEGVQGALRRAKRAASISKKGVSVHTLRHSYPTHLLKAGVNLLVIQKNLGHANIETTMIYLHLTNKGMEDAYGAMFKASSGSIKKLVKDPRFIGADLPGFTAVLHTWGRQMQYHPHLHLIVPAGGVSPDRKKWLPSRNNFYLPVRALSKIFKAKFHDVMAKRKLLHKIDPAVWQIAWNVNSQPIGDSEVALKHLAPYIFRVAISNSKIMAVKDRTVTFSYRQKDSNRLRQITLEALEFIRRFLQHVLPTCFMKVRHYGFMSSNCTVSLAPLPTFPIGTKVKCA